MRVKVGVDSVYIPRFRTALSKIIDKAFSPRELKNSEAEHLAGIFAAKEAAMKALSLKAGSWLNIEIANKKSGKPVVKLAKNLSKGKIVSCDLSISHNGDYAIAIFVALVE